MQPKWVVAIYDGTNLEMRHFDAAGHASEWILSKWNKIVFVNMMRARIEDGMIVFASTMRVVIKDGMIVETEYTNDFGGRL